MNTNIVILVQTSTTHSPWFLFGLEIFLKLSLLQFLAANNGDASRPTNFHLSLAAGRWFLVYSFGTDTQETLLPTTPVLLYVESVLWKRVYSVFAKNGRTENTASLIVASVHDAADTCISFHCLAMTTSTGSTIPIFAFVIVYLMST